MGLTIHYRLKYGGTGKAARALVEQLHQAAQDLPFKEVQDIVDLEGEACGFEQRNQEDPLRWLIIQSQGGLKLDKHTYIDVRPTRIIAFKAWSGEGCEESNFGLCQYPATIEFRGKRLRTKLSGWRWGSFCKTQYASDPACGGVENFLRCHLSIVALLDKAMELGCLEEVHDEGKFWENRDLQKLTEEIGSWNAFIAAFAGQMKDAMGEGLEAPITDFSNFEQLELAGQSKLPAQTTQLVKLIQQVIKKP